LVIRIKYLKKQFYSTAIFLKIRAVLRPGERKVLRHPLF